MSDIADLPCTAFADGHVISHGPLKRVALALKRWDRPRKGRSPLVFDDASGWQIDLDLHGSDSEVVGRLANHSFLKKSATPSPAPRGPGRPKLGVVAREVTLLPRHWEWLGAQPGGASVALRRLVDEARQSHGSRDRARKASEAAYRFMAAVAGNEPGYEETLRALFAKDRARFSELLARWPADVAAYAMKLAAPTFGDRPASPAS